jgi:nicotinamide-nucleotide amidase
VAITGIAGPGGGSPEKPVGMVCFSWAQRDGGCEALTCHFSGTRAEVREQAARLGLSGALKRVMAATLMA